MADFDELALATTLADLSTGGVVSVLAAVGKAIGIKTAEQRLDEIVRQDSWEFVSDAAVDMERFKEAWSGSPPTPTDVVATVMQAVDIYRRTNNRNKRELLRAALVNAFNPDFYEEGLTRRLLRLVDELEYGDIYWLGRIIDMSQTPNTTVGEHHLDGAALHHCEVLAEYRLIERHQWQLAPRTGGYSTSGPTRQAVPTWLGERLVCFVQTWPEEHTISET
jgi:hypothetical protein